MKLSRWHLKSFLVLYVLFTGIIAYAAFKGIDRGEEHTVRFLLTTAGSISGPMAGAIARGFQGCCLRFSLSLLKYALPLLVFGIVVQYPAWPDRRWIRIVCRLIWLGCWTCWFFAGIVSFGHALS